MKKLLSLFLVVVIFASSVGCSNNETNGEEDLSGDSIVYVSKTGKIHKRPNCSNMKYYTEMDYDEAVDKDYDFCKKCF